MKEGERERGKQRQGKENRSERCEIGRKKKTEQKKNPAGVEGGHRIRRIREEKKLGEAVMHNKENEGSRGFLFFDVDT